MAADTRPPPAREAFVRGGWMACTLLVATMACSREPSSHAGSSPASVQHAASDAVAVAHDLGPDPTATGGDPVGQRLSEDDGIVRVQHDDIAYAPLTAQALNDGDDAAWRLALPPAFRRHETLDAGPSSCGDGIGERIIRFEDDATRNRVELRACEITGAETYLAGFSLHDGVVPLAHELAIGDSGHDVLVRLGLPPAGIAQAMSAGVHAIEIVNTEGNNTLRLHLDGSQRVHRIEYEPYTG